MFGLFKSRKAQEAEEELALLEQQREAEEAKLRAVLPRSERVNSYKEAHVSTDAGYSVRGIVVDHSDSGLRIRFQAYETLPDYVNINVPGLRIRGTARVVWRDHTEFGLQMLEE